MVRVLERLPRRHPEAQDDLCESGLAAAGFADHDEADDATRPEALEHLDLAMIQLRPDAFHGEWNYSLLPRVGLL